MTKAAVEPGFGDKLPGCESWIPSIDFLGGGLEFGCYGLPASIVGFWGLIPGKCWMEWKLLSYGELERVYDKRD